MNQYTHPYSDEIKEKARQLIASGLSRSRTAIFLGIPYGTLYKWKIPSPNKPVTYSDKIKRRAQELSKSGLSRPKIAQKLGINIKTISCWILPTESKKPYPPDLREKARRMARSGVEKSEIAGSLRVHYETVTRWTHDITNRHSFVNGRYFLVLAKLANDGYFISNRNDALVFKVLRRHVQVNMLLVGKLRIHYLPGSGRKALKSLLARKELQPLTDRKISLLKVAFQNRG
jgi:transposase-like protein